MKATRFREARIVARDQSTQARWALPIWLALALGFASAAGLAAAPPDPTTTALREQVLDLRTTRASSIGAGSAAVRIGIVRAYEKRSFAPLWDDQARAQSMRQAIDAATTHGLEPRDYHRDALAALEGITVPFAERGRSLARRDLLLTDAFIRLGYHLAYGKVDPKTLYRSWNFTRRPSQAEAFGDLAAQLGSDDPAAALERMAPPSTDYRRLRDELASLREAERTGGWVALDKGKKLAMGDCGEHVSQLRRRLRAQGFSSEATEVDCFDSELADAVRRFQLVHGLEPDAAVGRKTLAALNVSVADRIAQVAVNLERLRWLARDLAGDRLEVDIAAFDARLWLDGALAWTARVIVGRPYRTTPEFRGVMASVVINPEWHVPPTILHEDLLPKLAKNPSYLAQHHMRLTDAHGRAVDAAAVDWSNAASSPGAFPYQIVESAGPDNSLGQLKFQFPNDHSVYLHDTPARNLFKRSQRAFSSGCIRVDDPLRLAELLLDDPQRWSRPQIEAAIAGGRTLYLPVRRTVPVLLLYFTARAEADGVHFDADLYGRDRAIVRALTSPARFGTPPPRIDARN